MLALYQVGVIAVYDAERLVHRCNGAISGQYRQPPFEWVRRMP